MRFFSLSNCRGKYGVVFKCESKATKYPHALKLMLKKGNKKEDVMREVDVLKKISTHPGVLLINEFIECTAEYILVTEL
jgi:serine/threonine protein kinase